jgi:hypothetical protein
MIPVARCEFCGRDVAFKDAVGFGPNVVSAEDLTSLAERFMRQEPDLELVFMHRECDALINGGSA